MALLDVQVACLANQATNYLITGKAPQRMGNAHPSIVPYQDFPTADGYMILAIGNDGQFERFARPPLPGMGRRRPLRHQHGTRGKPRRADPAAEAENGARTTAEWIMLLEQAGVPCGPINTLGRRLRRSASHRTPPENRNAAP